MAILNTGKLTTPNGYHVTGALPIDDRSRVTNLTDLVATNTFGLAEYDGQITYVKEDGNLYLLVGDTLKTGDKSNWKKIATEDSLSQAVKDLGPVFKFKGVADSIDKDCTALTLKKGKYTDSENNSHDVFCVGIAEDYLRTPHYAYGYYDENGDPIVLYWNEQGQSQQLKQNPTEETVKYIVYKDTMYFLNTDTNNFESVNEVVIYPSATSGEIIIYQDSEKTKVLADNIVVSSYKAYKFETLSPEIILTESLSEQDPITASSSNNGWVYQIGDKEYASNGITWVELGSPKDKWIVL